MEGTSYSERYHRQFKLEVDSIKRFNALAVEDMQQILDRGAGAEVKPAQSLIAEWHRPLVEAIRKEQLAVSLLSLRTLVHPSPIPLKHL